MEKGDRYKAIINSQSLRAYLRAAFEGFEPVFEVRVLGGAQHPTADFSLRFREEEKQAYKQD
jgi:hypothetical protein